MNSALMFSKASDEWSTPQDFYAALDVEFAFALDAAASLENRKVLDYLGLDAVDPKRTDALACSWRDVLDGIDGHWRGAIWLNPPYSKCREFIGKAAAEAANGCTVVCLVPSRTDTRWWHEHVWDRIAHRPKAGVEVRFVKGRLRFGGGKDCAPFPSVVIVFRPAKVA